MDDGWINTISMIRKSFALVIVVKWQVWDLNSDLSGSKAELFSVSHSALRLKANLILHIHYQGQRGRRKAPCFPPGMVWITLNFSKTFGFTLSVNHSQRYCKLNFDLLPCPHLHPPDFSSYCPSTVTQHVNGLLWGVVHVWREGESCPPELILLFAWWTFFEDQQSVKRGMGGAPKRKVGPPQWSCWSSSVERVIIERGSGSRLAMDRHIQCPPPRTFPEAQLAGESTCSWKAVASRANDLMGQIYV